jgi:hypothetical protein
MQLPQQADGAATTAHRPEGSHELAPELFATISSYSEAPTASEGIPVVIYGTY